MLNFSTKTAIVTGGSRGIGKEISLILAKNNFNVVAVATSEKSLDSIRNIENIHPFCSDISDEKSIEKLYEFVISKFGYADVLINNAGIHMDNILLRMKCEEWNQVMNVNKYNNVYTYINTYDLVYNMEDIIYYVKYNHLRNSTNNITDTYPSL